MISRRRGARLIGAAVAGLALFTGSAGAAGAAGTTGALRAVRPVDSADSVRSVLPFADGDTALELKLTKVSPAATGPDDELVVSGSVRNVGTSSVKNARISLWLRPEALADREAIDTWLSDGALTPADHQLPVNTVVRDLPSGATATFRLDVPPGQTGLFSSSAFGPRAIALQARVGGKRMASLRSTMVWAPSEITTPTRLSVLVPITSLTPSTHAGEATAEVASELAVDGRLQRVEAAANNQGMSWAIDPAILTAAQRLSTSGVDRTPDDAELTDPTAGSSGSPSSAVSPSGTAGTEIKDDAAKNAATSWLSQFKSDSRNRVFALPYADPDLTSVLGTGKGSPLIQDSDELGKKATTEALGRSLDTTLAWPADGRINAATTRSLVRLGRKTVVLADGSQRLKPELDYTPTGRSTVHSSAGPLTSLLYDEQLSALISSPTNLTPAATQTMLAQLAAITMEQPGTARHLLAVTPRTWNPEPTAVQTMMHALGSAPWISLRGISELQEATGPPRAAPVYGKAAVKAQLPPGSISLAQVLDKGLTTFAPILVDQAQVRPMRERVASMLSVAWRPDRDALVAARGDFAADVTPLVDGVKLVTSKTYVFIARETKIPVTVTNDTDYEVTVKVRLRPQSGQLTFDKTQDVTVKAHSSLPVLMEAKARASGNVVVEGKLLTVAGAALGPGKSFTIKVQPNWESWGMIVIGSIVGLLLVIGLLRSLRRNRNRPRVPIEEVPDVDETATRRAAAENESTGPAGSGPTASGPTASGPTGSGPTGAGPAGAGPSDSGPPGSGPPGSRPPGASAARSSAPPPVFVPIGAGPVRPVSQFPSMTPNPGPEPDSQPVPDPVPVPISMPDLEPDPKAVGGPVNPDGVRPPPPSRTRAVPAARPG